MTSRPIPRRRIWWITLMAKLGHPDIRYRGWKWRRAFDKRYEQDAQFRENLDALYWQTWER